MMDLFSTFDPSTSSYFSFNWLIMIMIVYTMPLNYFNKNNPMMFIKYTMLNKIKKEFSEVMGKSLVEGSMNFILTFLFIIIWLNMSSLLPFVFTSTSQMTITLLLAMSMWFAFFFFRILYFMNNFFSNMIPSGTPAQLMMFMVLIETISLMIRPITLAIRLSANMIAGHLLINLLGSSFFLFNIYFHVSFYLIQILLIILEMAVAIIQAYVFTLLIILYSMEI